MLVMMRSEFGQVSGWMNFKSLSQNTQKSFLREYLNSTSRIYISQIFHIFPFSEFIRTYFPVKSLFPSLHSLSKKSSAKYPVHSTRVYVSVLILKSWSWFAFRPFIYSPPSLGMCLQNLQNDGHLSKWREKNYNRVQRVRSGTGRGRFAGKASNLFTTLMQ